MSYMVFNRTVVRLLLPGIVLGFLILIAICKNGNLLTVLPVFPPLFSGTFRNSEKASTIVTSGLQNNQTVEKDNLTRVIKNFNLFGQLSLTKELISKVLAEDWEGIDPRLFTSAIGQESTNIKSHNAKFLCHTSTISIKIGILVCGSRLEQAMVMLKSAIIFSLDVNLHVIAVSDKDTITKLGEKILVMKLLLAARGYFGFTYELVMEWYPSGKKEPDWKNMYRTCSNQRLFFPSLLKHHDALIYLDTDVLVLANLTDMWLLFEKQMKGKMLGITPNSEAPGYYNPNNTAIPYYGKNGINAGVMLMNLTQLREFNFETRAKAIYTAYDSKIVLADQDIINGIFHSYPDNVTDIKCHYNFYWLHCDYPHYKCILESNNKIENICFCKQVAQDGMKILHGNLMSFTSKNINYPFVPETYDVFKKLDLYTDSYSTLFKNLMDTFNHRNSTPCPPLTADMLYLGGLKYLQNLGQ